MNDRPAIAVIGLGCRYPGAATLREFWENVIARRRQFRRLPEQRLPLAQYHSDDPAAADKTYATEAAVIDGFRFDWIGRGIPKPIFEASDIVHWLALDVALGALEDAGHALADGLPKERAGVILGNTLAGEHTRSKTLRLRWPFVERAIRAAAQAKGLASTLTEELAATTEQYFKSVFPPTTEDSLAGGLSNTIAGRICGYLGLGGGGYTVDGACASSLLAVATAATALENHTLDAALAGGVDVSLDTFELVGFAKAGALSKGDLRVYDRRANGFKPGEGCGFVVLKRLEDARAHGDRIYAVLRGWGIASDGSRAITAPKAEGQARAIRRAYERAGYRPQDLAFVEGHGTGTAVGDAVELKGLALAMQDQDRQEPRPRTCGVTSLKSIVGHTKAAAGVGGLIKAVLGANRRVLPPTAGCSKPSAVFENKAKPLYPILQGELRPASETLRVGVSAAGFGGINCHVTLESGDPPARHLDPEIDERALLVSHQETELFVLSADSAAGLADRLDAVRRQADGLSHAELVDLASELAGRLDPAARVRGAVIAASPAELDRKLCELEAMLADRAPQPGEMLHNPCRTVWLGNGVAGARVGLLFPGQGSQQLGMARTLVERFPWARDLVEQAGEWLREYGLEGIRDLIYPPLDRAADAEQLAAWNGELTRTEVAQPAICLASLLWMKYLGHLGVEPVAVGGHSLGELSAFHAAGAFDEKTLLRLAAIRGRAMAARDERPGAMASLACPPEIAVRLVKQSGSDVVVANLNSFQQTVISGDRSAVEQLVQQASADGIRTKVLPVSNAFHSEHVAEAAKRLRAEAPLSGVLDSTRMGLFTSTDGSQVGRGLVLADHFADQVVSQVHFIAMVAAMYGRCDLFVEVGPGRVLSGLVASICGSDGTLCLPVESKPGRDRDLNTLAARLFVRGASVNFPALYERRLVRPFVPANDRLFIDNPCERPFQIDGVTIAEGSAPAPEAGRAAVVEPARPTAPEPEPVADDASVPQMLLGAVEELTGFPTETLNMEMRLIDDLNLDSIKAAELIASVAKRLGIAGDVDPAQFGNATLEEIADTLAELAGPGNSAGGDAESQAGRPKSRGRALPAWVRNFTVDCVEEPRPEPSPQCTLRAGDKVLVLHEREETDIAAALREQLARCEAEVVCRPFDAAPDAMLEGDWGGMIAVLPRRRQATEDAPQRLRRVIHRLRSLAVAPGSEDPERPRAVAYVQFGGGDFGSSSSSADLEQTCAKALGASLHLERGDLRVRVLDFAPKSDATRLAEKVALELATPQPYAAAGYDEKFVRRVPKLRLSEPASYVPRKVTWSAEDVILVTGGAKGITAECALAVAERTGARMALVGSSPLPGETGRGEAKGEIAATLDRFAERGLKARYYRCDVADARAVAELLGRVEKELGPITGVVHGAAMNKPRRLADVRSEDAYEEVAPKVLGAINLCRALDSKPPKMLVGLSSIIGVSGMWRNGWYGFSNEAMERVLDRFHARHPETTVVCPAYSVWNGAGMGVRMGSTDYLARKGIGAIPLEEGVRRFVDLFENDPGRRQVVITARVAGLESTLPAAATPRLPRASRFLEDVSYVLPGVELVARVHLNVERDAYLEDHVWRGSRLFPTVFGLEAMAQAVAYLTGHDRFEHVRIEDVRLQRPIVVDPQEGLDVEIRAEAIERPSPEAPRRVKVGISTEKSDFTQNHFSAEFVLDGAAEPEVDDVELPAEPLAIDPRRDLYGGLLFQGPRFQRLRHICSLDSDRCVFVSEANPADGPPKDAAGVSLLGDAYFRDSLLQSVQLIVPQKIALPVHIDSLQSRGLTQRRSGRLRAVAVNNGETDGKQTFTVFAVDTEGHVAERLDGYTLGIVEHRPDHPTAEELANPGPRDERILRERLAALAEAFDLAVPELSAVHTPGLHGLPKPLRHERELPVLARVARAAAGDAEGHPPGHEMQVRWLESGRPVVEGNGYAQLGVSLSHDNQTLVCVGGRGPQGCDLHPVESRSREDWIALLANERTELLDELSRDGDPLDRAGTRIWSALEAFRKAAGAGAEELRVVRRADAGVLLSASAGGSERLLLTFPVKLTRGPEKMFAVAVGPRRTGSASAAPHSTAAAIPARPAEPSTPVLAELGFHASDYEIDAAIGPRGQRVMIARQPLTFRDNRALGGGIYFSNYFTWMGKIRELAVSPILGGLAEDMAGGAWGMVTNHASVRIVGDVAASGVIENRAWMERTTGRDDSTIELRFEWHHRLPDGRCEPIAEGEMQITWVRVIGHGQVEIAPLPQYVRDYIATVAPGRAEATERAAEAERTERRPAAALDPGDELYRTSHGPRAGKVLREEVFQTSLEDANLVGNIYFDNYAKWQGRLLDVFLFEAAPGLFRTGAAGGELTCRTCRVKHFREAMPFDRIRVSMGLRAVYRRGLKLEFEYSRVSPDGSLEKLAFGEQEAVWTVRDADGRPAAAPLPEELVQRLCEPHSSVTAEPDRSESWSTGFSLSSEQPEGWTPTGRQPEGWTPTAEEACTP